MDKEISSKLFAELVGSCFLVMIVVGSGIMAENLSSNQLDILLANTIATGAGLTVLIWIFISVSGAHFNPAVSLVMFLNKELRLNEFLFFIFFQVIGGLLGVILANTMFGLEIIQIAEKEYKDNKYIFERLYFQPITKIHLEIIRGNWESSVDIKYLANRSFEF